MKSKLLTTILTILPVLTGILVVLDIVAINRFAGSGKEIQAVNMDISLITQENSLLEEKVASYSSLLAVAKRAETLGYSKPTAGQYQTIVPGELPVALKSSQ